MFCINESLTANRNEDGSVDLNLKINQVAALTIRTSGEEWRQLVKELGTGKENLSLHKKAMKAHEKFVQLDLAGQFEVGVEIGLISKKDKENLDAVALHNAVLKMIREESDFEQIINFINQVEKYWKEQH